MFRNFRKGKCFSFISRVNDHLHLGLMCLTGSARDETPFCLSREQFENIFVGLRQGYLRKRVKPLFISLIRMRSKRDIKMGRLCTPGVAVLGIVGGGVTFRFLNGEAILDENMLFWVRLYALVVVLKILLDFRL